MTIFQTKTSENHTATVDLVNFFIFSYRLNPWQIQEKDKSKEKISQSKEKNSKTFLAANFVYVAQRICA